MSDPEDGLVRCPWAGGPGPMRVYHDTEWGVPVAGEVAYLERMTLEAFQSGLSWAVILAKRPGFRSAFAGFDADVIARYDDADVERLLADPGIVRNRRKIEAAITNARATVDVREVGGLEDLVLRFRPDRETEPATAAEWLTSSPESAALAKELKRNGFVFVGPTTMYALMQAVGVFDPHLTGCFRRGA